MCKRQEMGFSVKVQIDILYSYCIMTEGGRRNAIVFGRACFCPVAVACLLFHD